MATVFQWWMQGEVEASQSVPPYLLSQVFHGDRLNVNISNHSKCMRLNKMGNENWCGLGASCSNWNLSSLPPSQQTVFRVCKHPFWLHFCSCHFQKLLLIRVSDIILNYFCHDIEINLASFTYEHIDLYVKIQI